DDNAGADFRLHRRRIVDASTVIADCDRRRLGHRRGGNRDELPAAQGFAPQDDGLAPCDLIPFMRIPPHLARSEVLRWPVEPATPKRSSDRVSPWRKALLN